MNPARRTRVLRILLTLALVLVLALAATLAGELRCLRAIQHTIIQGMITQLG